MNKTLLITLLLLRSFCEAQNVKQGECWNEVNFISKSFKRNLFQFDVYYNTISDTQQVNMFRHPASHGLGLWYHFYPTQSIRLSTYFGWEHFYTLEAREEYAHERFRTSIFSQFNHRINRLTLSHRFALDYLATEQTDHSYKDKFRGRYRFRVITPLNKSNMIKGAVYVFALDELFLNFKKSPGYINQNRISISLGYCITDNIQFEPGYIFISSQNTGGGRTLNHVLQFTVSFNNILRRIEETP